MGTRSEKQLAALREHAFKKGQSGNPGGRKKGVAAQARQHAGEDGEKVLQFYADVVFGRVNASVAQRLDAARELLARAHGKAPDITISAELEPLDVEALSSVGADELVALIQDLKGSNRNGE